jgi:phage/plasmid-like protein (TIGR03299 family)
MAHEIETMMYSGEVPWHGLGTYVGAQNIDSATALQESGLDWSVTKTPIFATDGMGGRFPIKSHVAVRRNTDDAILGVVGAKYSPLQNLEAFAFMDTLVEDGSMRYHTAGSLRGGQRVWLLGQIGSNEILPNDRVDQFIMLYNAHDGSSALRVLWTEVRVVCANTARMALGSSKAAEGVSIRHTRNMQVKVGEAARVLGLAKQASDRSADFHRRLTEIKMGTAEWLKFIDSLIPDKAEGDGFNTRRENIKGELTALFEGGIGTDIAGVKGTAWGAYNAITEFTTHHSTVKSHKDGLRFENIMFGAGAGLNSRAVQLLAEYA